MTSTWIHTPKPHPTQKKNTQKKNKKKQELKRLPLLGDRVRAASDATPNARGDARPEDFIAPVVLPALPSRFYFKFGTPVDAAAAVAADARRGEGAGVLRKEAERAAAQRVYQDVKTEVNVVVCHTNVWGGKKWRGAFVCVLWGAIAWGM